MTARIFYLIHGRELRESHVADRLLARGAAIAWCSHKDGDKLPADVAEFDGVVVGGGVESVNDAVERPYLRRELAWIRAVVTGGKPYFGICLGAQLLAAAFGGRVGPRPDRIAECGYHPIAPTAEGAAFLDGLDHVYSFHQDGLELPEGAVRLAASEHFPNHAFRYGKAAFGVQFHPDCRPDMIAHWYALANDTVTLPGAQSLERQLALAPAYDPPMARWLDRFLDRWPGTASAGAVRHRRCDAVAP